MDRIPEKKTEEYSHYLDEVINELMGIKQSLKRGSSRKENRKEVANLQSAITALRHLRNKNNRQVNQNILLNNREKGLNEAYTADDTRNFLTGQRSEIRHTVVRADFNYDDIRNFLSGRAESDEH